MKWVLLILVLLVIIALLVALYRRTNAGSNQAQRRRAAQPDVIAPTAGPGVPPIIQAAEAAPADPSPGSKPAAERGADELTPAPEGEHRIDPARDADPQGWAQEEWHPEDSTSGEPRNT